MFAQMRKVLPGMSGAGEDVAHPGLACGGDVVFDFFAGLFFEAGTEDGVAEASAGTGEYA